MSVTNNARETISQFLRFVKCFFIIFGFFCTVIYRSFVPVGPGVRGYARKTFHAIRLIRFGRCGRRAVGPGEKGAAGRSQRLNGKTAGRQDRKVSRRSDGKTARRTGRQDRKVSRRLGGKTARRAGGQDRKVPRRQDSKTAGRQDRKVSRLPNGKTARKQTVRATRRQGSREARLPGDHGGWAGSAPVSPHPFRPGPHSNADRGS